MAYENTRLIKEDILFRGGEPINGSQYEAAVLNYINRVYSGIASGASEFVPEFVDDWWWLRDRGSLLLLPTIPGTVQLVQGSVAGILVADPGISLVGYKVRVGNCPDLYEITAHVSLDITLDLPFTCATGSYSYDAMKTGYTLDAAVAAITGPLTIYHAPYRVNGLSPEAMDEKYPVAELRTGVSHFFSLEDERTIRMSHGGRTDGVAMRADYRYRPVVTALTDETSSIPLIPQQWRHVLADMALTMLYLDKNDDRATALATTSRAALGGMIKENRRRFTKMDRSLAHIYPRLGYVRTRGDD